MRDRGREREREGGREGGRGRGEKGRVIHSAWYTSLYLCQEIKWNPAQEYVSEVFDDSECSVHYPVGEPLCVIILLFGVYSLATVRGRTGERGREGGRKSMNTDGKRKQFKKIHACTHLHALPLNIPREPTRTSTCIINTLHADMYIPHLLHQNMRYLFNIEHMYTTLYMYRLKIVGNAHNYVHICYTYLPHYL